MQDYFERFGAGGPFEGVNAVAEFVGLGHHGAYFDGAQRQGLERRAEWPAPRA